VLYQTSDLGLSLLDGPAVELLGQGVVGQCQAGAAGVARRQRFEPFAHAAAFGEEFGIG
jgi:hypothetical protein